MKNTLLYVAEDEELSRQRAIRLSEHFRVVTATARAAAGVLHRTNIDLLLIDESVIPSTAAFMIFSIRCQFPLMTIVRLEEENASEVPLYFQADYVVHASRSPMHWVDEVKRACGGPRHP